MTSYRNRPNTIGGTLDLAALSRLHFHSLDTAEQAAAIKHMADDGHSDHTIGSATGLSVEFVRQVLGDRCFLSPCRKART